MNSLKYWAKYLAIALFLLVSCNARADNASAVLGQQLQRIHSLQAHFTQTVLGQNGKVLQQSSGMLALQKPGKFRWETQQPSHQLLITDGVHTWFYDIELAQVTVQPQNTSSNGSPASLLSGDTQKLLQDFQVTEINSNNKLLQIFQLAPKRNNSLFQTLQLTFRSNTLQRMQLKDHLGQITIIDFSQLQINPNLSANLFHFTLPKGVDVVTD